MKFIICSSPRTGSHALASALDSHSQLNVAGECFYRPAEFGISGETAATAVASAGRYDGYILHRNSMVNCPAGGAAAELWAEILKQPDVKVINLKRLNYFAMLCSLVASQTTGIWHLADRDSQVLNGYQPGEHKPEPLRINPAKAEEEFRQWDADYQQLDQMIRAAGVPCLEITYESLESNWTATLAKVQVFLGVPVEPLTPATKKQNHSTHVENYPELCEHFAPTRWARYFAPPPKPRPKLRAGRPAMSEDNRIINGLWIGPTLSPLELLTIKSFIDHGHEFHLWLYDPVETDLPDGTVIRSAAEIIPRDQVFAYEPGTLIEKSVAGFSDIWRFAFLFQRGGWYVDMDVTCLKPFDFPQEIIIRKQNHVGTPVANWIKLPKGHAFAEATWRETARLVTKDNVDFILPMSVLGCQVAAHGLQKHLADPELVINLVVGQRVQHDHATFATERERQAALATDGKYRAWLTRNKAYAIHWSNQHHHWHGIDRQTPIKGTIYESLLAKHGLLHEHVKA